MLHRLPAPRPDLLDAFDSMPPLAAALTPPASWYLEPKMFAWERHEIFERNWLPLARRDQVAETGDFVTGDVIGNPYVVVRGGDGVLRGFHNVCRHHAAEVMRGSGRCRELRCGYHGWTYGLDGGLRRTPQAGPLADFDRADYGLVAFPVEEWGPFVFGHLAAGEAGRDLAGDLAPIADVATDAARLQWVEGREYVMRCNWKVFVENSLDGGYHVPYLHRSLARGLSLERYKTTVFDRASVQRCGARGDDRLGDSVNYAWLFPNLFLNRYGAVLDTNVVLPLEPDRCLVRFDWYVDVDQTGGEVDPLWVKEIVEASDQIQQEDVLACESVQRGLGSSAVRRGRYSAELEGAVHAFHLMMHRAGRP